MFFRWGRKKPEPESDVPTVLVERHEPEATVLRRLGMWMLTPFAPEEML